MLRGFKSAKAHLSVSTAGGCRFNLLLEVCVRFTVKSHGGALEWD